MLKRFKDADLTHLCPSSALKLLAKAAHALICLFFQLVSLKITKSVT